MKITQKDLDLMEKEINKFWLTNDKEKVVTAYETGNFPRSDKVKDLQKRFCWDLFYYARLERFSHDRFKGLNDEHLFTALRKICPKVERKY